MSKIASSQRDDQNQPYGQNEMMNRAVRLADVGDDTLLNIFELAVDLIAQ